MKDHLDLLIITPERVVCELTIKSLVADTATGEHGILPNHESLVTALKVGVVKFSDTKGVEHHLATFGGMLEVNDNKIKILTDIAELDEEIDVVKAHKEKERLEAEKTQILNQEDKSLLRRHEMAILKEITKIRVHQLGKNKKNKIFN